jgi:hypothetical protein
VKHSEETPTYAAVETAGAGEQVGEAVRLNGPRLGTAPFHRTRISQGWITRRITLMLSGGAPYRPCVGEIGYQMLKLVLRLQQSTLEGACLAVRLPRRRLRFVCSRYAVAISSTTYQPMSGKGERKVLLDSRDYSQEDMMAGRHPTCEPTICAKRIDVM